MKKIILLLFICATTKTFSQELTLSSPDQKITVNISLTSQLNYDVIVDDQPIISNATIDMQLYGEIFLSYIMRVKSTKTRSVNETIIAQIPFSRKNIPDKYNELTIQFKKIRGTIRLKEPVLTP